ncbi:MAG TPA: GNAT family N-acetyltransferase [Ramlibacter sp.]|jgi:GNAT superfamily N-acetyltransferase|uniref:GNAT family N-acetyltransferase n=1 Tax=Ramlibacter sp. TaxID=1917967 RepID=UPI002D284281|nr:GNAT family N-acetyltransferase [Ramlibacter sp.]HZY17536.1 GNAT family N-acetyltransferase [Ramlibacter sp.]
MLTRLARVEDLPVVQRLYRELRPDDPEPSADEAARRWSALLGQQTVKLIVAEHGDQLASTCMLALIPNFASGGRPIGLIEHVVTLSTLRGQGFAGAVLRHALHLAWSDDCCKVVLLSGAQRVDAHRLYESLGFRGNIERGFVVKPEWSDSILNGGVADATPP